MKKRLIKRHEKERNKPAKLQEQKDEALAGVSSRWMNRRWAEILAKGEVKAKLGMRNERES